VRILNLREISGPSSKKFSKVRSIVMLYGRFSSKMTFENFDLPPRAVSQMKFAKETSSLKVLCIIAIELTFEEFFPRALRGLAKKFTNVRSIVIFELAPCAVLLLLADAP